MYHTHTTGELKELVIEDHSTGTNLVRTMMPEIGQAGAAHGTAKGKEMNIARM